MHRSQQEAYRRTEATNVVLRIKNESGNIGGNTTRYDRKSLIASMPCQRMIGAEEDSKNSSKHLKDLRY